MWPCHVNVWQKPLQYCKVISLQLIKIHGKNKVYTTKRKKKNVTFFTTFFKGYILKGLK